MGFRIRMLAGKANNAGRQSKWLTSPPSPAITTTPSQ
jgi:hypothetical protein